MNLNGLSLDPVGLEWSAHEGIKDGYLLKSRYFTAVGCARPLTSFGECKCNAIDTSLHNHRVRLNCLYVNGDR